MSTIRGARERARIEVTAAIKDEARKQLAEEGAAKLSLRAVARELGMVS
ncbi:TetR/AcrR family transcriptional regulator, partial [Streptomyces sp. SID7499]|nr:TetR/AcrR family transcriptional regulator [Streptomyces sp. SID7499]